MRRAGVTVALLILAGATAWVALRDRAPENEHLAAPASATPETRAARPGAELAAPASGGPAAPAIEQRIAAPAAVVDARALVEIRDARGEPAAGLPWAIFRGAEVLAHGTTAADGAARCPRGAGAAELAVLPPSGLPQRFPLDLAAGRQSVAFATGAVVAGRVLIDGSPPAAPLALYLYCAAGPFVPEHAFPEPVRAALGDLRVPLRELKAVIGAGGVFRFEGLAPEWSGTLRWGADLFLVPTDPPQDSGGRSLSLARPAQDVVLDLRPGACITGTVIDPLTGAGVPAQLELAFFERGIGEATTYWTEADGCFSYCFPDHLPGRVELSVSTQDGAGTRKASFEIPADTHSFDVGDIPLRATRNVAFLVRDEAGHPLDEVAVHALSDRPDDRSSAISDAEGGGALNVSLDVRGLRAIKDGYEPAQIPLPAPDQRAVFVLGPGTVLEVRLPPHSGHVLAIHGAEAPFLKEGEPSWMPETGSWSGSVSLDDDQGSVRFVAKKDGVFRFSGVRPGLTLALDVLDRFGATVLELVVPPLSAGEHRLVEPLVLEAWGALAGRVLSPAGEPVAGARVMVGDDQLFTGTDGSFRATGISTPSVKLSVDAEGYVRLVVAEQPITVEPLELVLDAGRDVRVTLVGPDGTRLPAVRDAWLGASDVGNATQSAEPGVYVFKRAPTGPFTLTAIAGGAFFEQPCAAGLSEVEVTLPAWQPCTVRVAGWKERPWDEGSIVFLRSLDATPERTLVQRRASPEEEEVRFEVVFPGRYRAYLSNTGAKEPEEWRLSDVQVVEVTAAAPAQVTLKAEAP